MDRRARILLVDDDPMVLRALGLLLELENDVLLASSTQEARALLGDGDGDVDVVVSDQRMPGESGVALLSWIRMKYPSIVRILLTGYTDTRAMLGAINDAGAWHFVRKPWDNNEILSLMRRATEYRRQEQALLRSERRYRELFEVAPLAIARTRLNGEVLASNSSFRLLFAEPVGSLRDLLGDAWVLLAERLVEQGSLREEVSLGGVPVLLVAVLLPSDADGVVAQVCLLDQRDRLSARRAEDELARLQHAGSAQMLVSGMVHDFKNQLQIILSSSFFLEGLLDTAAHRECIRSINLAAQRARGLASDLLNVERLDASAQGPVDVEPIVQQLVSVLKRTFPKDTRLLCSLPADLPRAQISAKNLHHCLLNLLLNARDAVSGVGTLRVRAWALDGRVWISVEDDGVGIPADIQARIFEPFFTTKPVGEGTGLGLSMVRRHVQAVGGEVHLHSEEGRGTHVTLVLPSVAPKGRVVLPTGLRVVVLDEPVISHSIHQLLHGQGVHLCAVSDGESVLDADGDVFLVSPLLADVAAVLPLLRALSRPVIFLGESPERGVPVLPVPFDQEQLIQAIGAALAAYPTGAQALRALS